MVRTALVLLVLGAPRLAAAGGPTGMIGIGASAENDGNGDTGFGLTLDAALAFRVGPRLSLGVRGSIGTPFHINELQLGDGFYDTAMFDYHVTPIDLALTAIYQYRRLWVAPWVGEHFSFVAEQDSGYSTGESVARSTTYLNTDFVMFGLTAGVDLYRLGGNTVAVYADYRFGLGTTDSPGLGESSDNVYSNWSALTVGVAVHRL